MIIRLPAIIKVSLLNEIYVPTACYNRCIIRFRTRLQLNVQRGDDSGKLYRSKSVQPATPFYSRQHNILQ